MYRPKSVRDLLCLKSRECAKSKNPKSRDYSTFNLKYFATLVICGFVNPSEFYVKMEHFCAFHRKVELAIQVHYSADWRLQNYMRFFISLDLDDFNIFLYLTSKI